MKKGQSRQTSRKASGQQKKRKVSASGNSALKQQNMKEFKMEIDHEIAKCLDTIDRQGLKYLKQTLRSSTLFNDEIASKSNIKSPTKNKGDLIQEEIAEELDNNVEQPNISTDLVVPENVSEISKQKEVKLEKFQEKFQEPLKPFSRKSSSRQAFQIETEPKQEISQRVKKEVRPNKEQKESKQIKDKSQIDEILQKISQFPGKKLDILNKLIDQLEQSQKIDNPLGLTKPYIFKPEQQITISNPSAMKSTVNKNKNNEKATSLYDSLVKGGRRSPLYSKEVKKNNESSKAQSFFKNSQVEEDVKQIEIGEQIQDFEIERIQKNEQWTEKQKEKQKANSSLKPSLLRQSEVQVDKKGPQMKKSNFLKAFSISNIKKPLDIEITQSQQAQASDVFNGQESKMVRLGKKKLGANTLRFVLVNNRGHPSIVGLTCISLYNSLGKPVQIKIENIKSQNTPKLMKLFNGTYQTTDEEQMFTVLKKNAEIELEINEKIGGMRIWNYNKSEIESSKQTDEVEFYINDKLTWKGSIKKGSYNELADYCTQIKIEQDFEFEMIKKYDRKEIEVQHKTFVLPENMKESFHHQDQTSIKRDLLKHEQTEKDSEFIAAKVKNENENAHTNRFSQSLNIKNMDTKRDQSKGQANSLIDAKASLKSDETIFIKQISLSKASKSQISKERTGRSNSKKFEDEIDIFSSLGPNVKKVNQKSPINLPLQLSQDKKVVEKNSEEVIKKSSLGFSSLINSEQKSEVLSKIAEVEQKKLNEKPQQSFDDFMNDSIFQEPKKSINDKKVKVNVANISKEQDSKKSEMIEEKNQKYENANKVNIDDILNDLNDLVGSTAQKYETQGSKNKTVVIPELPKGTKMEIVLMSNWGDNEWVGLDKIQFFDSSGQMIFPTEAKSSNKVPVVELFSKTKTFNIEQGNQWKCKTKQPIRISLGFSKKCEFSFIRFWNFVGDRIHSMCGVRKIEICLDGNVIFVGDIRKSAGHSRDEIFKSCESILFTNNPQIQNKILENDWLTEELQSWKQEKLYFKKTSENFMRPTTNGLTSSKSLKIAESKEEIKLPKRNCFEYDPPSYPSGYFIKLILHSTWGDMNFVGLNGIIAFDENGNEIKSIKKISEYPAPLASLAGYEKDKRTLSNLFNGKNQTADEENIWLSPYLRDVDKMQKNSSNTILIEFEKAVVFCGINFYNYVKTPERGVRQIEIHVDENILYRGYLKMAKPETGQIHTTIHFTKEVNLLEKINYSGYHQDNLGQDVRFWNEGKPQKVSI